MGQVKLSPSEFARRYRVRDRVLDTSATLPATVKVNEYERDLTAGAHVASESLAMQNARQPLVRRLWKSN